MTTLGERLQLALDSMEPPQSGKGRKAHFRDIMEARLQDAGGMAGTSYRVLLEYLADRQTPSLRWISEAADILRVRPAWLAFGDGVMRESIPPPELPKALQRLGRAIDEVRELIR